MELTMVVVHEICHQWFGDLVTPVWWEDVWLKEGFAHFFEYIGTEFLVPKWNMEKLTDVLHEVMLLDGLANSHPISQEVFEATDIDRVFDWIAYKKGAALIRMLANVMGQPLFQRGLNAMRREGKDIDITEVMDRWTLQMGYPVVTISKNDSLDNSVTISQEQFVYDTDAKIRNPELFNKRAGYLTQNIPLQIISYLSQESEFLPWHAASRALYQLDKLLDRTKDHSLFSDYTKVSQDGLAKRFLRWLLHAGRLSEPHIVYCTGVSLMDEDVWEFIWMKFHSSTVNIYLLNKL
ncbi:Thyrotropin-releasing hormone-degrading ectoenzyme [Triplophysa tibetana]|uniref:Thyrotropin-releasing hormone-degrading ectoenzyme n=1 Tax=Triplophysa tibetana TaxID=1572043 RepID=A0A5A9PGG3_9TELE|nr:Thyrotropin-releasing hormone-degrading ectoenzyme [Triplophysa tibetana]